MNRIVPLDMAWDRQGFRSGSAALDHYFQVQVSQDTRRRVARCFVMMTPEQRIAGFYTLSSASVPLLDLPPELSRRLPRYPSVPVVRMGRLAIDRDFQGGGLGGALLWDALHRAARSEIAAYAVLVEAKDESAAAFYRHHDFLALPGNTLMLLMPLTTVARL